MTNESNPLLVLAKQRLIKAGILDEGESTTFSRESHELLSRDAVFCKRLSQSTNLAHAYGLASAGFNPYFCIAAKNRNERSNSPLGYSQSLFSTVGYAEYQSHFNFKQLGGCGETISPEMVVASFIHGLYSEDTNYYHVLQGISLHSALNFEKCCEVFDDHILLSMLKSGITSQWVLKQPARARLRGDLLTCALLRASDDPLAEPFLAEILYRVPRDILAHEASELISAMLQGEAAEDNHWRLGEWIYKTMSLNAEEVETFLPQILSKMSASQTCNTRLLIELLSSASHSFRERHALLILVALKGVGGDEQVLDIMQIPELSRDQVYESIKVFAAINSPAKLERAYRVNPHFVSDMLEKTQSVFKEWYGYGEELSLAIYSMPLLSSVPAERLGKDEHIKVLSLLWDFHQLQYPHDPNRYMYPVKSVELLRRMGALVVDDRTAEMANDMLSALQDEQAQQALLSKIPADLLMKQAVDTNVKKLLLARDLEI
jgi:hypothetical protein